MKAEQPTGVSKASLAWSPQLTGILSLAAVFAVFSMTGPIVAPPDTNSIAIMRGAGIGMGALLVFGRRLWPGILLGALAGRLAIELAVKSDILTPEVLIAILGGAAAATLQALVGATLLRRLRGFPLRIRHLGDAALCFLAAGPATCLICPTVGVGLAALAGQAAPANLQHVWTVWWVGDIIGVSLAVPVALLGKWNRTPAAYWKDTAFPQLSIQAMVYVSLSLVVTFASWNLISKLENRTETAQFRTLANDKEHELAHRLEAYALGLDGASALFGLSRQPTQADWRSYVNSLDLATHLPGVVGIGFIQPVKPGGAAAFVAEAEADGVTGMTIRSPDTGAEMFVVKYIEPLAPGNAVVGTDIAFDKARLDAALLARDSGKIIITNRIGFLENANVGAGFLMLTPLYAGGGQPDTVEERRNRFIGWVYAPFIGARLIEGIVPSQGDNLRVAVYDGVAEDPSALIFSNLRSFRFGTAPRFRMTDALQFYGQTWTLSWQSEPAFEAGISTSAPAVVLYGGLAFTFLLAVFLLNLSRQEENIRNTVTERTQALAAQVEENRSIIETAIAIIALLDEQGRILTVNDALLRLFGYDRAELIGTPLPQLLSGHMAEYFAHGAEVGQPNGYRGEVQTVAPNGGRLVLEVQATTWLTGVGERRYTVVMRNITYRRHVEDQLRTTQHRLDVALTGAKIGVFDVDLRTGRSVVSHTWKELLGYPPDAEIDSQSEWRVRIHPDDLIVVQAADRACIEGRTERTVSEYRLRMPDGNWRWMRSDAVGEDRDAEGRAWRLIGVQTDINDQRMVEELKSQFVSTVSHELRTPLTSINGSVGLLLNTMAGELPARARRMLTIAQKNCDRLILLVNDILDMEKIASGQARFKFVLADISTLVRKSVVANQPFAAKFDVTLAIMRTAPFSKALVDDSRFQQVMANLLSNAAKFSPRGGMVEVAIDLEGDLVKVSVTDHGAGIPPDFHGQIFKPFSQADSSSNRSTEGTGLGLNIASQIIERMGGGIGFDSQPGIRTTFWVTLPLADAATFAPAMPGAAPVGPDELVRRSKILHVEDDQDFAEVLAGAFGTTADLKNAEGESTARRMIAEEQYDLVILDWELQDGDGSALIADIQREQPGTPIIALTAKEREMEDPRVVATLIKSRATIPDIVALCLKSAGVAGS